MKRTICLALATCLLQPVLLRAEKNRMRAESTDQGIWLLEGKDRVLFYQKETRSLDGQYPRAGYVHPLKDLAGATLTEDFPADHPHHRGVFWAWHQCLIGPTSAGDGWACKDFQWQVNSSTVSEKRHWAELLANLTWSSALVLDNSGRAVPLVDERTRIRVYRRTANMRIIDFDIELHARVMDLKLGGSDNDKGYGGFSARLKMPTDALFVGEHGVVEPERTAVEGGRWMTITGQDRERGVTIMCHPASPGHPQDWILRRAGSMQNPVYPGQVAAPLRIGQPWRLRYRIVIWQDKMAPDQIRQIYRSYIRTDGRFRS